MKKIFKNGKPPLWLTIAVPVLVALLAYYLSIVPDYKVSVHPSSGQAYAGSSIQADVHVESNIKYGEAVELRITKKPENCVITLVPNEKPSNNYQATMTVSVGADAAPDDYEIETTACGADGTEHTCKYYLTVKPTNAQNPEDGAAEVKITYPRANAKVNMRQDVGGTVENLADTLQVHIVVYSYNSGRYYPQGTPVIAHDGTWSKTVYFGNEQDENKGYRLIVVTARENADSIYKNYMIECESRNSWPGLASLLDGCEIMDCIEVTR